MSLPAFSVENGNKTLTFIDMSAELGTGIIVIPFIAIIANVGIAKAFCKYIPTILIPFFLMIYEI